MAMTAEMKEVSSSISSKFEWKIKNFSKFTTVVTFSDVFTVGSFKWRVKIYPKGKEEVYDHVSFFLCPVGWTKSVDTKFSLAVTSQTDPKNIVREEGNYKFDNDCDAGRTGGGWRKFMRLSELHDPAKGYIVGDTCVIEVEITVHKDKGSRAQVP